MYGLKRKAEASEEKPKETLAHKMIRDIIGIDPNEILGEFQKVAGQISEGVKAMQSLDARVGNIETAVARIERRQEEGKSAS